jgi:hypothetical protein
MDPLTGMLKIAERSAADAAAAGLGGVVEGKEDALRHGLWQARTAQAVAESLGNGTVGKSLGPIAAQLLGLANEAIGIPGGLWKLGAKEAYESMLMDLSNNATAAHMGVEGGDVDARVLEAVKKAQQRPEGSIEPGFIYRRP